MANVMDLFPERILEAGMSYQVKPEADSLEWNIRLLDEAAQHGITAISHLFGQDGLCEPYEHWGLDYPSEHYSQWRNPASKNAQPETEYLPDVIEYAHGKKIKYFAKLISMEHSWLYVDHPDWLERNQHGYLLHKLCPDNPFVREFVLDYLIEFVTRYGSPTSLNSLDGIYLDHHRYRSSEECWCTHTREGFRSRFGLELWEASPLQRKIYRSQVVAEFTAQITQALRSINPELKIGLTEVDESWGHMPEYIRPDQTGLDFIQVQYLNRPDRFLFDEFKEKVKHYCEYFNEVWLQFDCRTPVPWTIASMGRFWNSIPGMFTMMEFAADIKRSLNQPQRLKGIGFFNISAVPENHPHRKTVFNCLNYLVPDKFQVGEIRLPDDKLEVNIT